MKRRLSERDRENSDYFISVEGLNPFIYEAPEFASYFDNCRQPKEWQYPVLNVVMNHKTKNDFYQDTFEFLKQIEVTSYKRDREKRTDSIIADHVP
jgi:hypothetical protein